MSPTGINRSHAGFTLMELLVVLAILGLALTLVPPELMRGTDMQALKTDVRKVLGGLRYAHTRAITSNAPVALSIDRSTRAISLSTAERIGTLFSSTDVMLTSDEARSTNGAILFYPDGTSSGGTILLSNTLAKREIKIDWLTGGTTDSGD
jgi:general secretion pathway protein H